MQVLLSVPTTAVGPTGLQLVGMETREHPGPAPDRLCGPATGAGLPGPHPDGVDHMQPPLPPLTGLSLSLSLQARGRYDWYRSKYRTPTHGANRNATPSPAVRTVTSVKPATTFRCVGVTCHLSTLGAWTCTQSSRMTSGPLTRSRMRSNPVTVVSTHRHSSLGDTRVGVSTSAMNTTRPMTQKTTKRTTPSSTPSLTSFSNVSIMVSSRCPRHMLTVSRASSRTSG
jgi:hypothetical protein